MGGRLLLCSKTMPPARHWGRMSRSKAPKYVRAASPSSPRRVSRSSSRRSCLRVWPRDSMAADQGRKRGVARLSHEYGPAVGHLAYQEGARKVGRLPGAVGRAVLGPAQEHVPPGRALDRRHETAALGKPGDRDAQCRTMFQKIRAATYPAKAGDGLECMQGDGPKALSVMVQLHTFPLFGEPGILRGDEQGIQIAFHPSSSHSLSR